MVLLINMVSHQVKAQNPATRVITTTGTLEGAIENGIRTFKGIAYAKPPVNELRWREPQPVEKWTGIKKAISFGAGAMQNKIYDDMVFRSGRFSEDCLYLNIWTPIQKDNVKLPVLVYFHGGGFTAGDGSEPRYDGESMARKDIIMVTINYRMGIFGFFSHPALSGESIHHASGNYGLLDQNAALKWVRANILAFGGDPGQVTIAGQSAGSTSVSLQMASPLSKGLFRSAIGQSGSILNRNPPTSLKDAELIGEKFMKSAGFNSIHDLKKLDAVELLRISTEAKAYFPITVDGYFLPDLPINIYTMGKQADVPLLAGWTSAEVSNKLVLENADPTVENFHVAIKRLYGENAEEIKKHYPVAKDEDVPLVATQLAGDRFAGYSTWKWIDLHGKTNGKPVYRYLYQQPLPPVVGKEAGYKKGLGAPHSADIPYGLGNLARDKTFAYTDEDYEISRIMQGFFVNFVKTGNPNGEGLPTWSGFQSSIPKVMMIGGGMKQEPERFLRRYQYLDQLYYK